MNLKIGDTSENGQITIIDEDRLCYLVKSASRGAEGVRTISKSLLSEYIAYFSKNPNASANDARDTLSGQSDIDKFEYGYTSTLKAMAQMELRQIGTTSISIDNIPDRDLPFPLQRIFYGAPGTGKSHGIKEKETNFSKVIRTTFHPDSDYSTFVGAYKPTMTSKERIYSANELIGKLTSVKESGVSYPCHKFSAQYWESLKDLPAAEIKRIITACGFTDTMTVEVGKGVSIGQELASKSDDKKITYSFVKQAFLKAYIEAWNRHGKGENVLLVIEEINRGNCAQIFGDLFQLLDRNDEGYSDYPIQADEDIRMVLADEFVNLENIPENVKSGEELLLPLNLYIWATMNTSDQSLFPMDSAFKRRWNWEYVKIKDGKKNWKIDIKLDDENVDWWAFIQKINTIIASMTSSADKQLGYFFCKADKDGVISTETFVSKVIFYLWNDVFKDYGFEDASLFRYKVKEGEKEVEKDLTFPDFYDEDGETVNAERLADFIRKVMNWQNREGNI